MPSKLIDPAALPTMSFQWGVIKPLVATDNTEAPDVSEPGQRRPDTMRAVSGIARRRLSMSLMHVVLLPGQGHERHNHPDADEILYILAGTGEQMVDDATTFDVRPGHAVWIPKGAFHSTLNTGWEPLVLLAVYAPAGAEEVLKTLPDYREVPAGEAPQLARPPM